jgi:hypothetical protein
VAVRLAVAEEAARQAMARGMRVAASPTVTKVIHLRGVRLPATLVDVQGQGQMSELVIRSGKKEYSLRVIVDGAQLYYEDYSWFESISQVVEEVAAFQEEGGTYILRLADIHFSKGLKVMALGTQVELDEVFCKLNVATPE